jgi:hypothetical protein
LFALLLLAATGCQFQQGVFAERLIQHQAMIDCSGLNDPQLIDSVKVNAAAPRTWKALDVKKTALYTDFQWRSPNKQTGLGVAYVHLPLPLTAPMIVWLARQEYLKRGDSGQVLGQWTDALGRPWFEAENAKYHIRGYVITKGFDAWIIYCGYKRTDEPPSAADLGLAARALETIVPTPIAPDVPQKSMAVGGATPASGSF